MGVMEGDDMTYPSGKEKADHILRLQLVTDRPAEPVEPLPNGGEHSVRKEMDMGIHNQRKGFRNPASFRVISAEEEAPSASPIRQLNALPTPFPLVFLSFLSLA
jgi:hypothetical protein